jgi:hypothetical protein
MHSKFTGAPPPTKTTIRLNGNIIKLYAICCDKYRLESLAQLCEYISFEGEEEQSNGEKERNEEPNRSVENKNRSVGKLALLVREINEISKFTKNVNIKNESNTSGVSTYISW